MTLRNPEDPAAPLIAERFGIAQDGFIPVNVAERQQVQQEFRAELYKAALYLNANLPEGREKSLALTKMEEALLWAGKAIFKDT